MASPLPAKRVAELLKGLPGWELVAPPRKARGGGEIARVYSFANYYETIAFVNMIAWISHRADHHPDLEVGYNKCRVRYSTHSVGGLSEQDFECARKIETLIKQ